jgi:hypothetical protein
VRTNDTRGGREVRWVSSRGSSNLGNGYRGGVCCKDSVGATNLGELREDVCFQFRDFLHLISRTERCISLSNAYWDCFNHKIDIIQVVHRCTCSQALASSYSVVFRYPLFCYIFLKKLVGELEAFVDGSLVGVNESDRH